MAKNIRFQGDGFKVNYKPSMGAWSELVPNTWLDITNLLPPDPFSPPMEFEIVPDGKTIESVDFNQETPVEIDGSYYFTMTDKTYPDLMYVYVTTKAAVVETILTIDSNENPAGFSVKFNPSIGPVVDIVPDVPVNITPYLPASPFDPPSSLSFEGLPDAILGLDLGAWTGLVSPVQTGGNWTINIPGGIVDGINTTISVDTGALPVNLMPANRSYYVDSQNLADFQNIPVAAPEDGKPNLTDYIVSLIAIPFKLSEETYADIDSDIKIANIETGIEAPEMLTDLITVSLGKIEITDFNNNSLDFLACSYSLVLPFVVDVIQLDPNQVVGKIISAEFVLDIYSGEVTINVYNGGTSPIHSLKSSLGRQIPIRLALAGDKDIGSIQGVSNGVLTAYIRKENRLISDGDFGNTITVERPINLVRGFVRITEIVFNTKALSVERDMLLTQLRNGVVIL